jgi:hypothetical protein
LEAGCKKLATVKDPREVNIVAFIPLLPLGSI